jgi:hypothetical protein
MLLDNDQQHRVSVFPDKDLSMPTKLVATILIVSSCKAEETTDERGNNIESINIEIRAIKWVESNNVTTSSNSPIATSS